MSETQETRVKTAEDTAAALMGVLNNYDGTDIRIVLDKILSEHRTLQQMFVSRIVIPTIRILAKRYDEGWYDARNEMACKVCKEMWNTLAEMYGIAEDEPFSLPMI